MNARAIVDSMFIHTQIHKKNNIAFNTAFVKSVRSIFAESGISIAEWARAEGFSIALVYQVIEGKRSCLRGQSHRIAVALGLKEGLVCDVSHLNRRLSEFSVNAKIHAKEDSAM